jgi:hypothetical protein
LRQLTGRNLLFSESAQAIYELDDFAAFLWRGLDRGLTDEDILTEVARSKPGEYVDRTALATALAQLREIRDRSARTAPSQHVTPAASEPLTSFVIELAGVAIHLHLDSALAGDVERVLGHLASEARQSQAQLSVRLVGERVEFLRPGSPAWSCARAEFVPLLKGELIEEVLRNACYEVALHAAAVTRNGRLLLLVGSPGAGKTTLAIALTAAGSQFAADDVVLVHDDGFATGLQLPFAAKQGSWQLLAESLPGLPAAESHRRPDGQAVRYALPDNCAEPGRRRIGALVLLDRRGDGATQLEKVDPTETLAALIAEGASRDERLSASGFDALVSAVDGARCCRLTYRDLAGAIVALDPLRW